jgi:hypothetical protein
MLERDGARQAREAIGTPQRVTNRIKLQRFLEGAGAPSESCVVDTLHEEGAPVKRYEKVRGRNSLNKQSITKELWMGRERNPHPTTGLRLRERKHLISILRVPPNFQPG